jgi:cytochrome P450
MDDPAFRGAGIGKINYYSFFVPARKLRRDSERRKLMLAPMPRIKDFSDGSFDPFVAEEGVFGDIADLHLPLARLRAQAPVIAGGFMDLLHVAQLPRTPGMDEFTVLSYKHVSAVYADPGTYSNAAFKDNLGRTFGRTITTMDPPEHSRYRRIFQKAFLPQNVAKWGDALVGPVVAGLMEKFNGRGTADLIADFAQTYPFEIIYRQLALPPNDGPVFHRLAVAQNLIANDPVHALEASHNLGEYFAAVVAHRRAAPGDDLASALVTATVDGERLPEDVVVSFLRQLINAAGDTTFRGTSVFLTALLQNPDQLQALRADRGLMPQAIEEALRWESPVSFTVREAVRDTSLAGVEVKAGSRLYPAIASANRDEEVFPDPHRFDIFRERKNRNVVFAIGPHICLGQHLARLEITRAVNAILDGMPRLRLDDRMPAPVIRGAMLRYPKHLHVRFD